MGAVNYHVLQGLVVLLEKCRLRYNGDAPFIPPRSTARTTESVLRIKSGYQSDFLHHPDYYHLSDGHTFVRKSHLITTIK